MKLLVYDKFWESFIGLPKGIQKKVVSFQKKFRENSKSSGIHLEPISTFKDSSLRSARIDQAYRAIIKAPNSGDIYYLLWVDHHDVAYKWASNKVFEWNDITQSMQMFTSLDKSENELINKEKESDESSFFSKLESEKLIKIGVPQALLPSIKIIDTYEDLELLEKFIPSDVYENLFYLLEGANIDDIILEVREGLVKEDDFEKQTSSYNNQRSFIELIDDTLFNEALKGSLDKWKYYLHPSQRKIVFSDFKGPVKISGGAGTGKTVAAIHRLKYLSENVEKGCKILFTTYTKVLSKNLKELIKSLNISNPNISIVNIDKLVMGIIESNNLLFPGYKVFEFENDYIKTSEEIWDEVLSSQLTSFSPEFLDSEYKNVILYHNVNSLDKYLRVSRVGRIQPLSRRQRSNVWKLVKTFDEFRQKRNIYYRDELFNIAFNYLSNSDAKPYDYCLIDEVQDFSNAELRMVRALVEEKKNDLFMVGDPMQSIYSKKVNFSKAGINIKGTRSRRLRINYRTTEEIKKLAVSVISDCHYENFDGELEKKSGYISLFHGSKPSYSLYKVKNEEVIKVYSGIVELLQSGCESSDIAICARKKDGLKEFRNILHKNKIPYDDKTLNSKSKNGINLLTFHKAKGLEFKYIFVVDVNDRTTPLLPYNFENFSDEEKKIHIKNEKSMLYVVISRAIKAVFISGVGRKSIYINL